jgi:iron complex transport system permease protein
MASPEKELNSTDGVEQKSCQEIDEQAQNRRERVILIVLIVLLVLAVLFSVGIGRFGISPAEVISIFKAWITGQTDFSNNPTEVVVLLVRLPRILLCMMVGAALSISGAAYQGLFRNPMVSPDILGVSAGAGVGASIAIILGLPSVSVQVMAFGFGMAAVFLVMGLASAIGRGNPATLIMVLAGIVVGSLFGSCSSLLKYLADAQSRLPDVVFWLMGSFAKSGSYGNVLIMFIVLLAGSIPLYLMRWQMNVLAFGEEEAQAMGVNPRRLRLIIILCSTLLTACSVAFCGTIGWVGLVIPHITRFIVGPNYKALLPTAILLGALFMLVVDDFARTLIAGEIPVGVITSIVGAPLFIYLLFKSRRVWV